MATSTTTSEYDYWDLLYAGQYSDVLAILDRRRSHWKDKDWRHAASRGTALLCLREYEQAADAFAESNRMAAKADKDMSKSSLAMQGGAFWLSGRREEGTALWLQRVEDLMSGKIKYADISGGVEDGLLLWYAGVSLPDESIRSTAKAFLRKASKRQHAKLMPGPLALSVIGGQTVSAVLKGIYGISEIDALVKRASADALFRRKLCQALLCWSSNERMSGDESACRQLLRIIATLENPLLQIEWFLARGETEIH